MLEQLSHLPDGKNHEKQESLENLGINNRSCLAQTDGTRGIVLYTGDDGANEFVDLYLRSGKQERVGTQNAASLSNLFYSGKMGIAPLPWLSEAQGRELDHRVRDLYEQRTDISPDERQNRINRYETTYRDRIAPRPEMGTRPDDPIDSIVDGIFNDIIGNIGKTIKQDIKEMDPEYQAQKRAAEDAKIKADLDALARRSEAERTHLRQMREFDIREQEARNKIQQQNAPSEPVTKPTRTHQVHESSTPPQEMTDEKSTAPDDTIEMTYNPQSGTYEEIEQPTQPKQTPTKPASGNNGDVVDMEYDPSTNSYTSSQNSTPLLTHEPSPKKE